MAKGNKSPRELCSQTEVPVQLPTQHSSSAVLRAVRCPVTVSWWPLIDNSPSYLLRTRRRLRCFYNGTITNAPPSWFTQIVDRWPNIPLRAKPLLVRIGQPFSLFYWSHVSFNFCSQVILSEYRGRFQPHPQP